MKASSKLVATQITSTLIDNIIHTITMVMALNMSASGGLATTIAFVAPYFLFSPLAGELGDRYSRSRLMFAFKVLELIPIVLMAFAIHYGNSHIALAATISVGTLAAFISPSRFSLISDIAGEKVLKLSSLMDGSTFMAVLAGTAIGLMMPISGHSALHHSGTIIIIGTFLVYLIGVRLAWTLAMDVPGTVGKDEISFSYRKTLSHIISNITAYGKWRPIMALSAFWGISSVMISEAEPIAISLGLDASAIRYIVPIMSVGIGCGALFTAYTGYRNLKVASVIMTLSCAGLCLPLPHGVFAIFSALSFVMCFAGGMLSSVLYAETIENTEHHTSCIVAGNNIANALVMSVFSAVPLLIPHATTVPRTILLVSALICTPSFFIVCLKDKKH